MADDITGSYIMEQAAGVVEVGIYFKPRGFPSYFI